MLAEFLPLCNGQAEYHDHALRSKRVAQSPKATALHERLGRQFRDLAAAIELHASSALPPASLQSIAELPKGELADAIRRNPTELSPDLLQGLPPELMAELNITETDRFEASVVRLINSVPGKTMLLDNIIIGLYLMTDEKHTRQNLTNRLYRMTRKSKIYPVPGKKGVYTTSLQERIDLSDLLDEEQEVERTA